MRTTALHHGTVHPRVCGERGIARHDGVMLRFAGAYQRDDTGQVDAVEVVVRGRHEEIEAAGITLETPVTRGEQSITTVALRKPAAGELRGIALADLLRLDVAALIAVLPRITTPTLTAQDVQQLDLVDLTALGTEVLGFFMSKADKANLPQSPTA